MAKQIKGTDIIEPKHLQEAYDQAVQLKNAYLDLDKAVLKASANLKKGVTGVKGNTVSEITAINTAYRESNKVKQSAITVTEQLRLAEDEVVKGKLRLQQATANQKKVLTEEIALENKQIGTLQKLAIESNKLRREREGLNLNTKEGAARLREINTQLDKNNTLLKKSSDAMKQQKLNVGNYGSAINKLTGFLSQLGLAFSAFTIMRDAMTTIVNFEKATASLSAITGATGDDLIKLKGTIQSLADEMKVSVTETTKLFEIVGSQMPQLLKDSAGMNAVAKSAIILSKASGDTVEASTLAMASAMNQFSLGADQAERVMNVLAAGSLVGSAGITDVSEAMKNFGSVASGANISVEESVALIEVLGKFGVVGAESGTKLRGSILKLQQANFGYASGQFEINDGLEEAKKKMDSLGSAMEKDAFLQKTFGAENIATGRILLSNIGLFEEYTKGVTGTNVATEQAAINSDTMSTVIKELKAAWENLVIKWSEGTDTLDGVKTVLRFVAENLETIISWVGKAVLVWGSYRVALKLWNSEGTGMIQTLIKMVTPLKKTGDAVKDLEAKTSKVKIGFAGWVGILVALLPYLKQAAAEVWEMVTGTTALDAVTEKYNEEMGKEKDKMQLLYDKLKETNAGSSERKVLIDQINATYGTTLENLSDETAFLTQLEAAYRGVVAQMEKKLMAQLLEEEYLDALKKKREAEKNAEALTEIDFLLNPNAAMNTMAALDDAEERLAIIRGEMARLNFELPNAASGFGNLTKTIVQSKPEIESVTGAISELTAEQKKLNEEMASGGKIGGGENIEKIGGGLVAPDEEVVDQVWGEAINIMNDANQKIADAEKAAMERRKKLAQETIDLMKRVTDALADEIDKRIAKENTQLEESEQRESYFRELAAQGNTDAAESVKAEQIAQAQQRLEIEALEKKKRDLLVLVTTLELASQKINSGDTNAMANAGSEMAKLIAKLPKFYEGTEGTVAEALGKPHLNTSKDGYLARLDGKEMVLTGDKTSQLRAAGLQSTSDVANAALAYHSNIAGSRAMYQSTNSDKIVSKLDAVEQAIKNIDIPEHNFAFDEQNKALVHTVKEHNRLIKNHQKTGSLF